MEYIGFWIRLVAALIDAIILSVVNALVGGIVGGILGASYAGSNVNVGWAMGGASGVGFLLGLVISIGYYVVYQSKSGQTLGKKAMGIRVVNAQGKTPSGMTFFIREIIGKLVSTIILFIGFLMIAWDGKKQGLHDKIAGTYVVRA